MAMNQITDHIYLGSYTALSGQKSFAEKGITHVLSLLSGEVAPSITTFGGQSGTALYENFTRGYTTLRIDIDDVEDENIMQYFDQTNKFISEAISSGGIVFVHCMAGVSRSTTAVCAYLMKQNFWSASEALEFVKSKRSVANPNESFYKQLEVYYQCAYEVSESHPVYRQWLLQSQAEDSKYTRLAPKAIYASSPPPSLIPIESQESYKSLPELLRRLGNADGAKNWNHYRLVSGNQVWELTETPSQPVTELRDVRNAASDPIAITQDALTGTSSDFKCRKCRSVLSTSAFSIPHQPPDGVSSQQCAFFMEPLKWMKTELEKGELEGKLACPKCDSKVGAYHWQGSKCVCGTWVTPAICLQRAKIDQVVKRYNRAKA